MSKTKPYKLSYFPGPQRSAVNGPIRRLGPLDYREYEYFDFEEEALVRVEELRISKLGRHFKLYKDEELLKEGEDLVTCARLYVFHQRKRLADD